MKLKKLNKKWDNCQILSECFSMQNEFIGKTNQKAIRRRNHDSNKSKQSNSQFNSLSQLKSPSEGNSRKNRLDVIEQTEDTQRNSKMSEISDKVRMKSPVGVNNTPKAKRGGYFSNKQPKLKTRQSVNTTMDPKVQLNIMQLLTLEKKDPMIKARIKIQKSIYKSIPKMTNGNLMSAQKKIPLAPLTASSKKTNQTFQTLEKKRLKPLNISSFDFDDKPYESAEKPSERNQLDFKSLKKYRNQFETVNNQSLNASIDAQVIFENSRHRSLNVSCNAAPEKRRNIMIKSNDGNSRNVKGFDQEHTSRFKENKSKVSINQSCSQPFQSSDATAYSETGNKRGAKAAFLHMKVMQSHNKISLDRPTITPTVAASAVKAFKIKDNENYTPTKPVAGLMRKSK